MTISSSLLSAPTSDSDLSQHLIHPQLAMEKTGFRQRCIDVLDPPHLQVLERGVARILSTDIALTTFAQIVDGLPLHHVAFDVPHQARPHGNHPITAHEKLCPGVLEQTREIRQSFSADTLRYDSQV
jgi:hypothetical protein